MMDCNNARRALWPPEKPKLAEADVLKASEHVEACVACRDYFAQDRYLLDAYDRMRLEPAPRLMRERIFDALARERSRGLGLAEQAAVEAPAHGHAVRRRALVVAAATVALIGGSSLFFLQNTVTPPAEGELFVEDYLRRAVGEDRIVTSDADEIRRFLTRELGLPIAPITIDGLVMIGAEICLLDGRRGAMIQYREGERQISHYVVPRDGTEEREPALSSSSSQGLPIGAPTVITWATYEIEQALVGNASPARLLELARGSLQVQ